MKIELLNDQYTRKKNERIMDSPQDLIWKLAANLIDRCNRDISEQSADDLKIFIGIHHADIKLNAELMDIFEKVIAKCIVEHGSQLAPEYLLLTGINKFEHYAKSKYLEQPSLPPISAEDMFLIEKRISENCRWNILKKTGEVVAKEKIVKYKVGQIVGARDCERRWWMARILFVFEDPDYPYPWYYVHFEGWGEVHNEWISSPERVKRFNAKRDFLKQ